MATRAFVTLCVFITLALALFSTTEAKPVDNRPAANTIACRDAQIFQLRHMVVNIEHNPLAPQGYNDANETVARLLDKAQQLQKLCK